MNVLTIELNEQFSIDSCPNSDGSVSTSGQNVVCVNINGGNSTSMSIGNLPHDLLIGSIKASNKAVSPSGHDSVIIQRDATASSRGHTSSSSSEHCLVLREIPNLSTPIFINRYKLIRSFWTKMKIIDAACMSISMDQE